jgi:YHS domain-containing protein
MAKQVDPVCGMQVEEGSAAGRSEHKGREYFFCSRGCKEKFDEAPEKYAARGD